MNKKEQYKSNGNPNWKGGKVEKTCLVCGKKIFVFKCFETKRKYCSYVCFNISKKGRTSGFKGKKFSKESIEKIKEARKKQVRILGNTSIEIKIQKLLEKANIKFKTHYPILGQPDIFIKPNICIFADGCYWHKCPTCGFGQGRERDEYVTKTLQSQGYTVIRLWEHEIKTL